MNKWLEELMQRIGGGEEQSSFGAGSTKGPLNAPTYLSGVDYNRMLGGGGNRFGKSSSSGITSVGGGSPKGVGIRNIGVGGKWGGWSGSSGGVGGRRIGSGLLGALASILSGSNIFSDFGSSGGESVKPIGNTPTGGGLLGSLGSLLSGSDIFSDFGGRG